MDKLDSLYLTIANCGYITEHMAASYLKISTRKLNDLVDEQFLNKSFNIIHGKVHTIYILSDRLKNILRTKGYKLYKTSSFQLEHDYVLLHTYLNLPPQIKLTWLNETALKEIYPGNESTTDAMFSVNNENIAVEVITPTYSSDAIANKMHFAINYADRQVFINTSDIKF